MSDNDPVDEKKKSFYEVLGVEPTATQADIKKAYRKLAGVHHPDKNNGSPESTEIFKKISEAYKCLSNEESRKEYDSLRENPPPLSGIFQVWEAAMPVRRLAKLDIPLVSTLTDTQHIVSVKAPVTCDACLGKKCSQCNDTGRVFRDIPVSITVPRGIIKSMMMRVDNTPAGNILLQLQVVCPPNMRVDEATGTISQTIYVPFWTALLGGKVQVPTLEGEATVTVPKLSNGQVLSLRGKGVFPSPFSPHRANMILDLRVDIPDVSNVPVEEMKTILESLERLIQNNDNNDNIQTQ